LSDGFFQPTQDQTPPRWYRVRTISGKDAGLGFCCPDCHLAYRYSAPAEIRHCGRIERAPRVTLLLPVRSLGGTGLPGNLIAAFWD